MADLTIKKGDTHPPLQGLAAEDDLPITGTSSDNAIHCPAHGYVAGDIVYFPELSGGDGLVAEADFYYVITPTRHTFKVSTTAGGSAAPLTSDISAGTVRRLLPLATAISMRVLLKGSAFLITGTIVTALDPPVLEGGQIFNWRYNWVTGDTSNPATYQTELEITWSTVPLKLETVPNAAAENPTVEIVPDNA